MRTIVYTDLIDRSGWPDGPWGEEPDKAQWLDRASGLPCLCVRNHMGVWCGYVGVPTGHPCFGLGYSEAEERFELDVHGALTFSDFCMEAPGLVCHVVEEGEDDRVWWLGFDCGHAFDLVPRHVELTRQIRSDMPAGLPWFEDTYRPLAYAREQVMALAAQLAALTPSR